MESPKDITSLSSASSFEQIRQLLPFQSQAVNKHCYTAYYNSTDMIVFNIIEDIYSREQIMRIVITINDIYETIFTIPYNELSNEISTIYNYVKNKSSMNISNNILYIYGTHIGRSKDYKYNILILNNLLFNDVSDYNISFPTEQQKELVDKIYNNMIKYKNL